MPFATINECRLAYRLRQAGPESVVFVHGLGASRNSFDRCFDMETFQGYTLAAIDLPGCGESGWPEDFSYTMKDQAGLVLTWIQSLRLRQTILVGHSMGGVICLYLAEALGAQAKAFFNLEGNLSGEDCTFSARAASMSQEAFETHGFQQFKKSLQESLQKSSSPGLNQYYDNISRAYPRGLYLSSASLVQESCEGDLKTKFLKLSLEKWYVFGERSLNLSMRRFLDQHDIPYWIVPDSGHFMMDDQPGCFYPKLFEALGNS